MLALLRSAGRSLAAPRAAAITNTNTSITTRSLYIQVREGHDPERVASRLHGVMNEDGIMRTLTLKRFHEKKWQKRKRKVEEQTIRHANRKIGSMIDFILRRKKAYVYSDSSLYCVWCLLRLMLTNVMHGFVSCHTVASKRTASALVRQKVAIQCSAFWSTTTESSVSASS